MTFFVDALSNLQNIFRPSFLAVVKFVQQREIFVEYRGIGLDLLHHLRNALEQHLVFVLKCNFEMLAKITVELMKRHRRRGEHRERVEIGSEVGRFFVRTGSGLPRETSLCGLANNSLPFFFF